MKKDEKQKKVWTKFVSKKMLCNVLFYIHNNVIYQQKSHCILCCKKYKCICVCNGIIFGLNWYANSVTFNKGWGCGRKLGLFQGLGGLEQEMIGIVFSGFHCVFCVFRCSEVKLINTTMYKCLNFNTFYLKK
jgi:hypothetical protein